jgi:acrylyl-CoA reductase (NADPH)
MYMSSPTTSRAFTVGKVNDVWTQQITEVSVDNLGEGDVLIAVEYSCINYKDGLATSEKGRVARIDPLIAGVDLAGTVLESASPDFFVGQQVIAHGYDIGVARHGGYSALARIPAQFLVAVPTGMTTRTAMMIGTAGFTAALSVDALERAGLIVGSGPVLVTGATGGVGSVAVGMLAARGYEVVASTGKAASSDWLKSIGASDIILREETSAESPKPRTRAMGRVGRLCWWINTRLRVAHPQVRSIGCGKRSYWRQWIGNHSAAVYLARRQSARY